MAYYLTNLLQDTLRSLGKTERFIATGGSVSQAINSTISELAIKDRPKNKDVIGSYIFVGRDAGGAGAAPEGQFKRCYKFDPTTYAYVVSTFETANFTAAIAAGDEIVLTDPEFPIPDMISAINDKLTEIFYAPAPDTSLTTVANQQNYSLPVGLKMERPRMVEIQATAGDVETYRTYDHYDYIPTATASAGVLHFWENLPEGMTIRITYRAYHPPLTTYNSELHETIPIHLAKLAAKVGILEWYAGRNDDDPESTWPRKLDIARSDFDAALREHNRVWMPEKRNNRLPTPGVVTF